MATHKQPPHPSGRVVSVRLPEELIQRLDALAERTQRSRGVYLRLALAAMIPQFETYHWHQQTAQYETDVLEAEFLRLTSQLFTDEDPGQSP
ncbi:ribbon-helix-helix domain-containing protein [Micrococcus sp. ACRRV]|uniref:ribbon-helix-helix domain-containing protein n=1 Tax=Micrococcus sp. ACRRV TaxID=2918203 RepID=UPI00351D64E8|nr:ribbon-helix-helix domain-containing protein [Micrococcus sp. ACRRV]